MARVAEGESDLIVAIRELSSEIERLISALSRNAPPQLSAVSRNGDSTGTNLRESAGKKALELPEVRKGLEPAPKERVLYSYSREFEEFWKVYPLKKDKADASAAFRKVTQRVPASFLIEAARIYRDDENRELAFTKYPARWLRSGAYEDDDPLPPRKLDKAEAAAREREAERKRKLSEANRLAEAGRKK